MSGKYPWQEDEGELDYPNYQMGYGGYQPSPAPSYTPQTQQAPQEPSNVASYIGAAGLGLSGLGTIVNAYGAYKQGEQAEKDFELQKDAYQFDKAISLEDRERQEEERRRRAELEAGNYAGNYLDNAIRGYGGYNAMTGR